MTHKKKVQAHRKVLNGELDCSYAHPQWKHVPSRADFEAAEAYLALTMSSQDAKAYRKKLWEVRFNLSHYLVDDILRAAKLELLPLNDIHVSECVQDIGEEILFSPVLLIRGNYQRPLSIAYGYHRLCASYYTDESSMVPTVLL